MQIRVRDRSPRAITAGSAARSSTRCISPTSRTRSGPSGIGILLSEGFHQCATFLATYGATACAVSMSPTCRCPIDSLASGLTLHRLGGRRGLRIRRWARRSGGRGGRGCLPQAPLVRKGSCSASSSRMLRRCKRCPRRRRASLPNLQHRRPEFVPEKHLELASIGYEQRDQSGPLVRQSFASESRKTRETRRSLGLVEPSSTGTPRSCKSCNRPVPVSPGAEMA
jgi:hypothetical protein